MTRRKLLIGSAPIVLLVVIGIVKLASMGVAGNRAATAFAHGDVDALRRDVAVLRVLDVVDPDGTAYAAGTLAVLEGRLPDAEREFIAAGGACPALVNLALVRETLGDQSVADADGPAAIARYRAALATVGAAPANCFAGNQDSDPARNSVRAMAEPRLKEKLAALERPLPPLPPPAAPPPPPPPPASAPPSAGQAPGDVERRLNPGTGDPLDRLRQLLQDGASVTGGP